MKPISFEEDEKQDELTEKDEFDWRYYGDHEQSTSQSLEGKDIVAIFIAALQTIFLPLVILAVAMLLLGIAVGLIF